MNIRFRVLLEYNLDRDGLYFIIFIIIMEFLCKNNTLYWTLKQILSGVGKDIILLEYNNKLNLTLWEQIRGDEGSLVPIIVIGTIDEKRFLEKLEHIAFKEKPYNYGYQSIPINLKLLLNKFSEMENITDLRSLDTHIQRYADINFIFNSILHNLKNAINNNDETRIKQEINWIYKNLSLIEDKDAKSLKEFLDKYNKSKEGKYLRMIENKLLECLDV